MMTKSKLCLSAAFLSAILGLSQAQAADDNVVSVSSWGGTFQDAEREAMFQPFEKATGIKVVEGTQPYGTKIRVMVKSGNIEWDAAEVVPADLFILANEGLLEPIDYSKFDKDVLASYAKDALHKYGVGTVTYGRVIAWNTKKYSQATAPKNWVEFFDVQKFPGRRVLDAGDYTFPPIEYALLGDGVKPDALYPLDFERAYKMLTKIKPFVIKWAKGSSEAPQALVDGEADLAVVSHSRIAQLKEDGAPVDFTMNGDLLKRDYWVIPKGTKHYEAAMKFIEFVSRPEQLAATANKLPVGSPSSKSFDFINPKRAPQLPTYAENLKTAIYISDEWWAETDAKTGMTNRALNVELWNKWAISQ
ncbi:MAG: ABC transporter substrate-binding protein [Hyphomicrobiales bacterium]